MQNNLSFSVALIAVKEGRRICREGWNGKKMFVFQRPGDSLAPEFIARIKTLPESVKDFLNEQDMVIEFCPYLCLYTPSGQIQNGWVASQPDMLAQDWCVLD